MNVYQIVDNEGWVLDVVIAASMAEAMKVAAKETCEWHITCRGPAGDRAWSKWMSDLPSEIGGSL